MSNRINDDDLYGTFNESIKRRHAIEDQAVRKAWNLPADDGMRDFSVNHTYPPKEKSAVEKALTAALVAAAIATPIGGLVALPSIINACKPAPVSESPTAAQPPVINPPPAIIPKIPKDTNDVFELGLHPPAQ